MELNLNNKHITRDINASKEVGELDFWHFYLKLINVNTPFLTDREVDVLAYILSMDYNKPVFARGNQTKIAKAVNMSKQQFSKVKDSLIVKEFLVGEREIYPHPNFKSFQAFVKSGKTNDFTFKFPYTLKR